VSETALSSAIREALLATGKVLLWRNNTGKLQDRTGRWVTYGIGVGGADLVGLYRPTGRFVAWEVKTLDGKLSPEQRAWHAVVTAAGGAVFTARSVDEAMGQLRGLET
jgi:hypothetical protein